MIASIGRSRRIPLAIPTGRWRGSAPPFAGHHGRRGIAASGARRETAETLPGIPKPQAAAIQDLTAHIPDDSLNFGRHVHVPCTLIGNCAENIGCKTAGPFPDPARSRAFDGVFFVAKHRRVGMPSGVVRVRGSNAEVTKAEGIFSKKRRVSLTFATRKSICELSDGGEGSKRRL